MNLHKLWYVVLILVSTLTLLSSCSKKDDPISSNTGDNGDNTQDEVTYTANIKSIFDTRCISCHASSKQGTERNGAPANVNFDTYNLAVTKASRANLRIQAGTMPPTGGISQNERDLFQQWIDQGLLE